jgi:hypothetical protein
MNLRLPAIFALMTGIAVSAASAQLANPSFESGLTGWNAYAPSLNVTVDSVSVCQGDPCTEFVANGDFSAGGTGWTTWTHRGQANANFAATGGNKPSGGSDPFLQLDTVYDYNGGVYQALSLTVGQAYDVSVLTRKINASGYDVADNVWFEVLVGTAAPQAGQDYIDESETGGTTGTTRLLRWDTDSCSDTNNDTVGDWNGNETTACAATQTTFTATASTMYLVLKVGRSELLGTEVQAYTEGQTNPLGTNPNATDGTQYAGLIKSGTSSSSWTVLWQEYAVQNHAAGTGVNFNLEMDIACWADGGGANDYSQIEVTIGWENDGLWDAADHPGDPKRVCDVLHVSHRGTGNERDPRPFRHVKLTGNLPDDPQDIILRILIRRSPHDGQDSQTLIENVVFTAESGAPLSPPAGSLLENGDFEQEPYNITYNPHFDPEPFPVPTGWLFGGDGSGDDGPGQGFTNSVTSPTDPLGVTTTDGTHFYGVAKPSTVNTQPKMTLYQVLPVTNFDQCAGGLRYKLHYLSNNSVSPEPPWWDHSGTEVYMHWMTDGSEPPTAYQGPNYEWIRPQGEAEMWLTPQWSHVRYTNNEQSGMTVVEATDEFDTVGPDLDWLAVEYVVFVIRVNTWRPPSEGYTYRALIDDVRFEVESIIVDELRLVQGPELAFGDCELPYGQKLGCGQQPFSFNVISGVIPPGLSFTSDGWLQGQPTSPGTYTFTVELDDASDATPVQKEYTIEVGGNCCGEVAADFDGDGDVDQDDFAVLQACFSGTDGGVTIPPAGLDCTCADLDRDGLDVDHLDLIEFEKCASGPDVIADINCDNQACCFTDGSCEDLHHVECLNEGGTPKGEGTICATTQCPWMAGCCLPDGTCQEMMSDECIAQGGAPRDPGEDCTETCTQACCYSNGYCADLPMSQTCYGTAYGPGSQCLPDNVCPE